MPKADKSPAPTRVLLVGLDKMADPPVPVARMMDGTGSRKGSIAEARAWLDELERDYPSQEARDDG